MDKLILNDEEYDKLHRQRNYYDLVTSDPWRCDFCDWPCTCDDDLLDRLVDEMVQAFPRLDGYQHFLENWIIG